MVDIMNSSYGGYLTYQVISILIGEIDSSWIINSKVYTWKLRYTMSTYALQTSNKFFIGSSNCILLIVNNGYTGAKLVYST